MLHDIDVYVQGINAAPEVREAKQRPWTRVDIYAFNALTGQIFGQGGGDEARRSQFLAALQKRYGTAKGKAMFDDFTEFDDAGHAGDDHQARSVRASTDRLGAATPCSTPAPEADRPRGTRPRGLRRTRAGRATSCSSARKRSATGHPLFVAGPQIGYTTPA